MLRSKQKSTGCPSVSVAFQQFCLVSILLCSIPLWSGAYEAVCSDFAHIQHAEPKPAKLKGIPRFGEVTPNLYRGGRPTDKALKKLSADGVDIVVDLRGNSRHERHLVSKLGMRYVPLEWHCPFPRDKTVVRFLGLVRDNPDKKIFVHCRLGDDRTGMIIAAYRMTEQGWSSDRAYKEMRANGFSPLHHMICPGLAGYVKDFPEHLRTNPSLRAFVNRDHQK